MNGDIGWSFPPTGGGAIDGFNDSGIAHFKGSPMSSLARETIQNSLDARRSAAEPVHVSFELVKLDERHEFGKHELAAAIEASLHSPHCNNAAEIELRDAKRILEENTIQCLRVSDRNTTGLRGNHWRALVKTRGLSIKSEGAGGSHGIGKAAPFAVTPLRTVFYWTHYRSGGRSVAKCQGKAVLMSHDHIDGGETQGTGFFGIKDSCRELEGDSVPEVFRIPSADGRAVEGTALYILGFRAGANWRRRIAESVISNYFYAIATGALDVIVEPDANLERLGLDQIDAKSLTQWFEYLENEHGSDDAAEEGWSALAGAKAFWELSCSRLTPVEKQDQELGHCRLWIKVAEGLPGRVGFVRNTGMLITTQQRNLMRFPGFRDFAALCVFEDPAGNELLRLMENPQHDQFEPDRLPESRRDRGRRALKRITDWIRAEIRKCAGPPQTGGRTMLTELAAYLPDSVPDESFDEGAGGDAGKEPGFGERVKVSLKPVRRPAPPGLPEDGTGDETEGTGDERGDAGGGGTDENGGEGGSGGSGEGDGQGGTGGAGGPTQHKTVPVSAVRLLPLPDRPNCYRLSFRSESTGVVRLELHEAGDSSTIVRRDVRAVSENGTEEPLETVQLADGGRTELTITADEPMDGRAWRLSAVRDGNE